MLKAKNLIHTSNGQEDGRTDSCSFAHDEFVSRNECKESIVMKTGIPMITPQ